jgi:hypothetical protein
VKAFLVSSALMLLTASFSRQRGITFPLLSDIGSATITPLPSFWFSWAQFFPDTEVFK